MSYVRKKEKICSHFATFYVEIRFGNNSGTYAGSQVLPKHTWKNFHTWKMSHRSFGVNWYTDQKSPLHNFGCCGHICQDMLMIFEAFERCLEIAKNIWSSQLNYVNIKISKKWFFLQKMLDGLFFLYFQSKEHSILSRHATFHSSKSFFRRYDKQSSWAVHFFHISSRILGEFFHFATQSDPIERH